MKTFFKMLLATIPLLVIFSSCTTEPALEKANYTGPSNGYVYWYEEEGRDKDFEKAVIEFANTFLQKHPRVADKEIKIITDLINDEAIFSNKYYDENLRAQFIDRVNLLIPRIDELEDYEIVFEMESIVAMLKDGHSVVYFEDGGRYYPLFLEAIYTESDVDFYALRVPSENEDLAFAKLIAINGVPVKEVAAKAEKYLSAENIYHINAQLESSLLDERLLKVIDVVEKESDTADYTFIKDDGTEVTVTFSSYDLEGYYELDYIENHLSYTDALMYKSELNFWYEFIDEETLYIRLQGFFTNDYSSLLKIVTELNNKVTDESPIKKTIVDIRDNSGGQKVPGYNEFIEMLNEDKFGNVYALINEDCFSMAVIMPSLLKQNVKDIVLVGTPTGEPPLVFGVIGNVSEFSGSGVIFQMGEYAVSAWEDYEYDALMPDITVYQTIEDYKNGIDSVLEAVLEME